VAESAAFNLKPSPSAPINSAVPLPQKVRQSADFSGEPQLDPRHPKADSVVQKLKPSMALKRAKRDPIGQQLCDATDLAEYMLHPSTGVIGAFG